MFNWLPLPAMIEDRIVCMHGGALFLARRKTWHANR